MGKQKLRNIDFRYHPYRGIFAEIAREDGVERQAVQKRMRKGDPYTLDRVTEKMKVRKRAVDKYNRTVRSIGK